MEPETSTIAAIAAGDPDFSILVSALEATSLTAALDVTDDELTVFAPTNAAFAQLAVDLGFTGDTSDADAVETFITDTLASLDADGDPVPLLSDILLYHVSPGAQSALAIENSDAIATLSGTAGIVPAAGRLVDLEPDVLDASITMPDIAASNGTLHVIDRVLLPIDIPGNDTPSIADIAATTPGFEILNIALTAAGLETVLGDANGEFTVFAPTNDAFIALSESFGFTGDTSDFNAVFDAIAGVLATLSVDGDPIPVLTDILLYHVSAGAQSVADLTAADQVATVLTDQSVVVREGGIFDADPDVANADFVEGLTEVAASNGVIQAVDAVLLPFDLDDPAPTDTITDTVAASGDAFDDNGSDFDILLAAVGAAGLADTLANPDASFTVFAPVDAAFLALAAELGQDASSEQAAFDGIVAALTGLSETGDPIPLLTSILTYHVVDGAESRASLASGAEITTVFGAAPAVDGRSLVDVDPGFAEAAFIDGASDLVQANGVIHAIDAVLLPINVPDASDLFGTDADEVLTLDDTLRLVDGDAGADSLDFGGELAATSFGFIEGGFSATTDGTEVQLFNLEQFEFSDATLDVETTELAAQVFRLYGVGLGREGDIAGVSFWFNEAETQGINFVADAVLVSQEFADQFGGTVPGDEAIVGELYQNFLGREADADGLAFWNQSVADGVLDTSDLLLAFSESDEFKALSENSFDDGVLIIA
ncbi:MAG: fasciclin domain-containing protein [Pseudomonadota bacterium]